MIQTISDSIERLPRWLLTFVGFSSIPVLGMLDYLTGYEISFAFFYLVPVGCLAWFVGREAGIAASVASAVVWQSSNILAGESLSSSLIFFWNASTRFGFFVVVTVLLSRLRSALAIERRLSRTDPLTGIRNRRAFYDRASAEMVRARRHERPLTVVYVDLDDFKGVNDRFGHEVGDLLLITVAATIRLSLRETDIVSRLGGDEFVVLLPETNLAEAREPVSRMLERLRRVMAQNGWSVTASAGVLSCDAPPESVEALMREADRLMYDAKRNGKDAVLYGSYGAAR